MKDLGSSETSLRCHHCAGPLTKDVETTEWTVSPFIRDSFSMVFNFILFYFYKTFELSFCICLSLIIIIMFLVCYVTSIDWLRYWWHSKCVLRIQPWYGFLLLVLISLKSL